MKIFRINSFNSKISLLTIASCLFVAVAVSVTALSQNYKIYSQSTDELRKTLYADFDTLAKSEVQTAVGMLQGIYERHQKGEFTLEQAKKIGASQLNTLKYGKDGYIIAYTTEGINVAHPIASNIGTSRYDVQDKKGNYIIRDFIKESSNSDGGYTVYWTLKYTTNKADATTAPKRSYVVQFKPFNWVVVSGNYIDDIEAIVMKQEEKFRDNFVSSIYWLIGLTVFCVLTALFIASLVTKKVLRQLGGEPAVIAEIAEKIAAGDLTMQVEMHGKEATGAFAAMNRMTVKLKALVTEVKSASEHVASGSAQLSASSEEITRTMNDQSNRSSQIATAAEEMSQTVIDIAKNASNIAQSSSETAGIAKKGAAVVEKSVIESKTIVETVNASAHVMQSLGQKSKQIGEIVDVINDIADQTNLLALNAAIEAARAGEQGRGFAVVADEVRKLAERTAKATSEISQMIGSIQGEVASAVDAMNHTNEKVNVGLQYSVEAGEQLKSIVQSVTSLQSLVQQIATATEEMSTTSEAISGDIQAVAGGAREISGGSDQIAQSSSELARLAGQLKNIVDQFKV
jgi:methyl-accepting chemotaxis protein